MNEKWPFEKKTYRHFCSNIQRLLDETPWMKNMILLTSSCKDQFENKSKYRFHKTQTGGGRKQCHQKGGAEGSTTQGKEDAPLQRRKGKKQRRPTGERGESSTTQKSEEGSSGPTPKKEGRKSGTSQQREGRTQLDVFHVFRCFQLFSVFVVHSLVCCLQHTERWW